MDHSADRNVLLYSEKCLPPCCGREESWNDQIECLGSYSLMSFICSPIWSKYIRLKGGKERKKKDLV